VVRSDVHYLTAPGCAAFSLLRALPFAILGVCRIPFAFPHVLLLPDGGVSLVSLSRLFALPFPIRWVGSIQLTPSLQYPLAIFGITGIPCPAQLSVAFSLLRGHWGLSLGGRQRHRAMRSRPPWGQPPMAHDGQT
jgi:hypothetical protein